MTSLRKQVYLSTVTSEWPASAKPRLQSGARAKFSPFFHQEFHLRFVDADFNVTVGDYL